VKKESNHLEEFENMIPNFIFINSKNPNLNKFILKEKTGASIIGTL